MFQQSKWRHICLGLAIFFIPFDFSLLLFQGEWGRGFFNPYLSQSLHLHELFILLSGFLALFSWKKLTWKNNSSLLLGLAVLLFLGLNSLGTPWLLSKLFVWALFLLLFTEEESQHQHRAFLRIFIMTMTLQALYASIQFFSLQSSELVHQAKFHFASMSLMRSYGSFAHPNILAALLGLSILMLPQAAFKKRPQHIILAILLLGIFFSFSRLTILALFFSAIPLIKNKKQSLVMVLGLATVFILRPLSLNELAFTERVQGIELSLQLWQNSNLWGLGFRQSTAHMDTLMNLRPWEYQPAHNIPILLLTETGLAGVLMLVLLGIYSYKNHGQISNVLLFIIITSMGDHYWITSDQSLLALIFALYLKKEEWKLKNLLGLE